MNIARRVTPEAPVAIAATPEALSAVLHPDCPAVLWDRQPLAAFQHWIDGLAPTQLPRARIILRPGDVRAALSRISELCGTPDCAERAMLIDDAAAMAHIFGDLMEAEYLQLRLDVVTTNACRKFHVDAVTARLVCTYRGTGTQYGVSDGDRDPGHVSTVPTGAPILLRGTRWPGFLETGLRHRSPPIEGTGETRLVLVLDPVAEPSGRPGRSAIQ